MTRYILYAYIHTSTYILFHDKAVPQAAKAKLSTLLILTLLFLPLSPLHNVLLHPQLLLTCNKAESAHTKS